MALGSPTVAAGGRGGALVSTVKAVGAGALKFTVCLGLGTLVAGLLFRFDSILATRPFEQDAARSSTKLVEFVRVEPEEYIQTRERRLPQRPPPPDQPPPPPKFRMASTTDMPASAMEMSFPDIEMSFGEGGGPYIGQWYGRAGAQAPDGDAMPIVRITPQYPRQALLQGIEGWVRVEFTIMPDGSVRDPLVVSAEPSGMFDRAAVQAVLKWKFKPRYVDGEAIARRAVQVIDFRLED